MKTDTQPTDPIEAKQRGGGDCVSRLVLALLEAVRALENPISFVWPADEDGEHIACFTPSANPDEMLVVVDANALLPALKAAILCQNAKTEGPPTETSANTKK